MRESSEDLSQGLSDGLVWGGAEVFDLGLLSTPAFYFGVCHLKSHAGVMVSASHNPAAHNGFKMVRAQARSVSGETGIQQIAGLMEGGRVERADTPGSVQRVLDIPQRMVQTHQAFAGGDGVGEFHVVADAGNGMGAQFLEDLFVRLPQVTLDKMFWEPDGSFPHHEPDPMKEENLRDLQERVRARGADLGIATDGDGDRIFFVDDLGEIVPPMILRGLLAQIMLRRFPRATICYDVRPGRVTEEMIVAAGGKPSLTPVGHSLIKDEMRRVGAVFGGESSGHLFYAYDHGVYEGPVTAVVQLLQELTRRGVALSELVRPYRIYAHSGEINRVVPHPTAALESIKERFHDGELSTLDGVSISYPFLASLFS
jgi:phosphomannomutase